MNENFEILYELLTTGSFDVTNKSYDLSYINQQLLLLNCAAREWYDKRTLILVYSELPAEVHKTSIVKNDVELFKKLVNDEKVSGERMQFMVANGWATSESDGSYALSKKFMMQFKDFILKNSEIYKECSVCKIVVKGEGEHPYCRKRKEGIQNTMK